MRVPSTEVTSRVLGYSHFWKSCDQRGPHCHTVVNQTRNRASRCRLDICKVSLSAAGMSKRDETHAQGWIKRHPPQGPGADQGSPVREIQGNRYSIHQRWWTESPFQICPTWFRRATDGPYFSEVLNDSALGIRETTTWHIMRPEAGAM